MVAEYLVFKGEVLQVHGIGAPLNYSVYELGDHRSITLCVFAMVLWVILINLLFWRPLYRWTLDRFKAEA